MVWGVSMIKRVGIEFLFLLLLMFIVMIRYRRCCSVRESCMSTNVDEHWRCCSTEHLPYRKTGVRVKPYAQRGGPEGAVGVPLGGHVEDGRRRSHPSPQERQGDGARLLRICYSIVCA